MEQSVTTPLEQQISGVDNMEYMSSTSANNGNVDHHHQLRHHDRSRTSTRCSHNSAHRRRRRNCPCEVNTSGTDGTKIAQFTTDVRQSLFAEEHLRRHLPVELRIHQPCR
ncbi:MAG: hypothetical protein QM757_42080 [Paludibaculum sp.]